MKSLELKVPPAALALIFAGLMWGLARLLPALQFNVPGHTWLAGLLLVGAILLIVTGLSAFWRAGTTVDPIHPDKASVLITDGIFRYTRNSIYLGFLLGLVAIAIWLQHLLALLLLPLFVCYMNRFQIQPEERTLEQKFGDAYRAYRRQVRRWI